MLKQLRQIFDEANEIMLKEDIVLFNAEVSERTLCGALLLHIRNSLNKNKLYKPYYVDVEYNRNNTKKAKTIVKTINGPEKKPIRINQLMTRRSKLTSQSTSIKNQLHTQLNLHYHHYNKFFCDVTLKTSLAFWYRYPSAMALDGVTVNELGQFLREESHNNLAEKKATAILDMVEADGDIYNHDDIRSFLIQNYIEDYRFRQQEIQKINEKLKVLIDSLDLKLDTIYGINFITTAQLVAEIGNIERFKNARKLEKYSGVSPVTYSSGAKEKTFKNKQGNRQLRKILFDLSVRQIQVTRGANEPRNPYMYEYYQRKIQQGKTKTQALVYIARRLVNIIFSMMKYKTAYNPSQEPPVEQAS